ncbi:hypothetical protein SAMN04487969_101720 [Paenibacillus algorifonticola]|uniref:DUF4309 domain-containing protein n=1 Tax=Paenibacillus algorifonticola TaxID=684063 RepID=A0A1I1YR25_9BACL|nr:hypothetical protein [Paenibacillus algorifonticola]SFE21967.1 hypothetical protein SAMN04487969_101720 [Paenibacillus algorifonticola]
MTNMKKSPYRLAKYAAVVAIAVATAGCQSMTSPSDTAQSASTPLAAEQPLNQSDSPQKTYLENSLEQKQNPVQNQAVEAGEEASTEAVPSTELSSNKTAPAKTNEEGKWNAAKPALLGLAIGDSKAAMTKLFGAALDSYTLEEENQVKIEVHEYDGFAIGLSDKNTIQYIEVYDKKVKTGLSGVKIGDDSKVAVKALGKPTSQSGFIIAYEGTKTLLKLDLDPELSEIVSIKLLARS